MRVRKPGRWLLVGMLLGSILGLAIAAPYVFAATTPVSPKAATTTASGQNLTLKWVAPTTYVTGAAIASGTAITYNVYGAPQGQTLAQLQTGVTALTNTQSNVPYGTQCYAVSATVAGVESAQTTPACVTLNPPATPPSGLTVTVSVTANTAYTLIKEPDKLVFLPVGTVPPGTQCILTEFADGYFVVPRASVTFTGNVQPPAVFAKCS